MFKRCSMRSILFNPSPCLWSLALARQHYPGAQVSNCSPNTVGTNPLCSGGEESETGAGWDRSSVSWAELNSTGLKVRGCAIIHSIYFRKSLLTTTFWPCLRHLFTFSFSLETKHIAKVFFPKKETRSISHSPSNSMNEDQFSSKLWSLYV